MTAEAGSVPDVVRSPLRPGATRHPLTALVLAVGVLGPAGHAQPPSLPVPTLVEIDALRRGNPLAQYARLRDLERDYRAHPQFGQILDQVLLMHEEFMGIPDAGLRAMHDIDQLRQRFPAGEAPVGPAFEPRPAIDVIAAAAARTRIVIWGEEHHLPQTRSLYEPLLRRLFGQGYRYLAAETFTPAVTEPGFRFPDYGSGVYLRDPVFASAVRVAVDLGFRLVWYEETAPPPPDDPSFRDRRQAENIKTRILDVDPLAKVLVLAGRGHASERPASDGWTPMASVLKGMTGIDPVTVFAVRMGERLTPEEEDPRYRSAVAEGMVPVPTVFVDRSTGRPLADGSFDMYVFWPRTRLIGGRPDWLERELGRIKWDLPAVLVSGRGLRLVQAFRSGEPAAAVPIDQVLLRDGQPPSALMLPAGRFWIRTIDRAGTVLARIDANVPSPSK